MGCCNSEQGGLGVGQQVDSTVILRSGRFHASTRQAQTYLPAMNAPPEGFLPLNSNNAISQCRDELLHSADTPLQIHSNTYSYINVYKLSHSLFSGLSLGSALAVTQTN